MTILVTWDRTSNVGNQSLPLVEHHGSYGLANKCQSPENVTFAFGYIYKLYYLPSIYDMLLDIGEQEW